jgi:hypothetical protein
MESSTTDSTNNKASDITIFSLDDENHPVNEDDEEISYIGERISNMNGLEKCIRLKVAQ